MYTYTVVIQYRYITYTLHNYLYILYIYKFIPHLHDIDTLHRYDKLFIKYQYITYAQSKSLKKKKEYFLFEKTQQKNNNKKKRNK